MASNDKTGPGDEVEGSWSPKRPRASKAAAKASTDPDVLAQEIEQTREELAETLDAIADKVSPKKVVGRTKKAAKEGAADAVEAVKGTAASAVESVKGSAAAVKEKVAGDADARVASAQVPVEPAPTPGALADAATTVQAPAGIETPYVPPYTSTLPPPTPSRVPVFAGAGVLLLLLYVLKRRRR